ncbi:MAG: chitobiase/beta-hexosaminidase C-terminal domain-containing protein [bacterium]
MAGPYKDSVSVTIACATAGAKTYYTTDGSGFCLCALLCIIKFVSPCIKFVSPCLSAGCTG